MHPSPPQPAATEILRHSMCRAAFIKQRGYVCIMCDIGRVCYSVCWSACLHASKGCRKQKWNKELAKCSHHNTGLFGRQGLVSRCSPLACPRSQQWPGAGPAPAGRPAGGHPPRLQGPCWRQPQHTPRWRSLQQGRTLRKLGMPIRL